MVWCRVSGPPTVRAIESLCWIGSLLAWQAATFAANVSVYPVLGAVSLPRLLAVDPADDMHAKGPPSPPWPLPFSFSFLGGVSDSVGKSPGTRLFKGAQTWQTARCLRPGGIFWPGWRTVDSMGIECVMKERRGREGGVAVAIRND